MAALIVLPEVHERDLLTDSVLVITNFLQNCVLATLLYAVKCHGDYEAVYQSLQTHLLALFATRRPYFAMLLKTFHDSAVLAVDSDLAKVIAIATEQPGERWCRW